MARAAARPRDEIMADSRHESADVRRVAARELCPCQAKVNDPDIWDRIIAMTRDPDVRVRRIAFHDIIDGSPRNRQPEVVTALRRMHDDPDAKLRRQVRKTLARHHRTGRVNH